MASLTIRNLDEAVLDALRKRAAASRRSMEEEARRALAESVHLDKDRVLAELTLLRVPSPPGELDAGALVRAMRQQRADREPG